MSHQTPPNQSPVHRPSRLNPPPASNFTFPPRDNTTPAASPLPSASRITPSPMASHRQSFSEQMRIHPSSPRIRHPSMGQQAIQELLNNPPLPNKGDNQFRGRDWRGINVGEVIDPKEVHWSEYDTNVEDATALLVSSGAPNVVLVRENAQSQEAVATFDYSDLNGYLLLVVGLVHPDEAHSASFNDLAKKGKAGKPIPLRDIGDLGRREPLVTLPNTAVLPQAVEIFGSGIHRIIIVKEGTKDVMGVLTQLRLVRFFWEYGRHFPAVEPLFGYTLQDLNIGSKSVKSINGDRPLSDALELMDRESVTSLPVLDNSNNVVGNISHVDVRLLTKTTSLPLLRASCIHFISVILSERGVDDGKDSFPVFYVQPYLTLAHSVAKLVATRSHRMWIVDSPSPVTSAPQTPSAVATMPVSTMAAGLANSTTGVSNGPHHSGAASAQYVGVNAPAVSASALPGQKMSGRLSGVISLTDVLNLIGRASGLDPRNPDEARRLRRRRSSSSSVRSSTELSRSMVDLSKSTGSLPQR